MKIVESLFGFLMGGATSFSLETQIKLVTEYQIKNLAVQSCINLIANTVSGCEFRTFQKGKSVRGENYYLLNVEPNKNQNSSEFMQKVISKLMLENQCVCVMYNDELFVVESFELIENTLQGNKYKDVKIGEYIFNQTLSEKDILHFKLNDENIINAINGVYESYGKLISSSMNGFKRSHAKRMTLKDEMLNSKDTEKIKEHSDMLKKQLKDWFSCDTDGTVFPLQKGGEFKEVPSATRDSRDIRALIDDIFDFITIAFNIPKNIFRGDTVGTAEQVDAFLMFKIKPLCEMLQAEFNRKVYTKSEYLERTYLEIDTKNIKTIDLVKFATASDKLFSIGAFSINDILERLGQSPISEDWANERFITKNYEKASARSETVEK